MRVLMCGSRHWTDSDAVRGVLDAVLARVDAADQLVIIEGEAKGADRMAATWAVATNDPTVTVERYPADWEAHGRGAGPRRNRRMLTDGGPDLVIAFCDDLESSRGTADMVRRASKAGIPTVVHSHDDHGNIICRSLAMSDPMPSLGV